MIGEGDKRLHLLDTATLLAVYTSTCQQPPSLELGLYLFFCSFLTFRTWSGKGLFDMK